MIYQYPLIALNRDGKTRIFVDAKSFCAFAYDRQNGGVGGYWRETHYDFSWDDKPRHLVRLETEWGVDAMHGVTNTWIVRDNCGRVVDKSLIDRPVRDLPYWVNGRRADARRAAEQGLPIPGSGHCRRRYRSSKKWTKNGRNGAHNQRKGIRLYEDPYIHRHDFDGF